MNSLSAGNAIHAVDVYEGSNSVEYIQSRALFLATLSLHGSGINDPLRLEFDGLINKACITDFVGQLPRAVQTGSSQGGLASLFPIIKDYGFEVESDTQARALQSNVAWLLPRMISRSPLHANPFYIIGDLAGSDMKEVLIASASLSEEGDGKSYTFALTPSFRDKPKIRNLPESKRGDVELVSPDTKIDRKSDGSLQITSGGIRDNIWGLFNNRAHEVTPRIIDVLQLSDDELMRYNVLDRLVKLAFDFDAKNALIDSLERHFIDA